MAGKKSGQVVARSNFVALLADVKGRIQSAQTRAVLAVNAELVRLYWDIGRIIDKRQQREGWGAAVIPRLARALHNELPDLKCFSERNIKSMVAFYREYPDPSSFVQQPVAQLPSKAVSKTPLAKPASKKVQQPVAQLPDSLLWSLPWGHHILLMFKVRELSYTSFSNRIACNAPLKTESLEALAVARERSRRTWRRSQSFSLRGI